MQTSFILMIIFFILVLGFAFVISKYRQSLGSKIDNSVNLDQVNRYQLLNFLPELRCSLNNVHNYDCFDKQRLESFKMQQKNSSFYYNNLLKQIRFSVAVYADDDTVLSEEVIFNNTNQNLPNKRYITNPILVYDNEKKMLYQGVLNLEIFS